MMNQVSEPRATYGGKWTREKLEILEKYLDAYTTALKKTSFKLMYIDAFAGTGHVDLDDNDEDTENFIRGSAIRAVSIDHRPFDKLIFVEEKEGRCSELEHLRKEHPGRDIQIENSDANEFLRNLQQNWERWRGVLFLDPFATEVEWTTIEKIAGLNALDTWILFPVSAIARMLPTSRQPDDISVKWAKRLTRIFGDENWRNLYQEDPQGNLFGDIEYQRDPGVNGLIGVYKNKLKALFGRRLLEKSRTLKNSRNSPLFEFMFCVGNPKGIKPAKPIAEYILEQM
ncbi:MAG: three-Cys-motif partner protein TcmP [Nitrospira sp.]|nr:three-Cys-motif partner protein TcmP [Nitrospira sp.]